MGRLPLFVGRLDRQEPIKHLSWLGCLVKPVGRDCLLKGLIFEECNLRGTIFEDCIFFGVTFRKCLLDGTIFRNCRFLPGEGDEEVQFDDCHPNSLGILGCTVESMRFKGCGLRQPTFAGLTISAPLRFTSSVLYLALFEDLRSGEDGGILFEDRCELQYCCLGRDL